MRDVMRREENEPTSSSQSSDDPLNYYVPYPVQNSVPYFPNLLKNLCLEDFRKIDEGKGENEEKLHQGCDNFDSFSRRIFGETLQRIFIRPYNEKVALFFA